MKLFSDFMAESDDTLNRVHAALDKTHHHLNDDMLKTMAKTIISYHKSGQHSKLRSVLHKTYGLETSAARSHVMGALRA